MALQHAAMAGGKSELARLGLGDGPGYPRIYVEVIRVDELPAGIMATGMPGGDPLGRGLHASVSGRAWVVERAGAAPTRDTGDLRRTRTVAAGSSARDDRFNREQAVTSAARALGSALVRRVLGMPTPADDR